MKESAGKKIREKILNKYVSSTMQAYYREKGYEWPDSLLAAIVGRDATYEDEKLTIFKKLASVTDDPVLKQELETACRSIIGNRKAFRKSDPGIIYKLEVYNEEVHESIEIGFFTDAALAEEVAAHYRSDKTLTRYMLIEARDEALDELNAKGYISTEIGHMSLNPDGKIYECQDRLNKEKTLTFDELRESFELRYYGIRHPFRAGDIIHISGCRYSYGVASFIRSDAELEEKIAFEKENADLFDEAVAFDCPGMGGYIAECRMPAWEMDIIPWDDAVRRMKGDGCSKQYIDLIMSIARLRKGVGSLPSVIAAQEAYKAYRARE